MRMWMVNPILLCKKHLLGEHNEIHKFRHTFEKGYKLDKRLFPVVQIVPLQMEKRHDVLVKEMVNRGYKHNSPYIQPPLLCIYEFNYINVQVDLEYNIIDLMCRCKDCEERILKYYENYNN